MESSELIAAFEKLPSQTDPKWGNEARKIGFGWDQSKLIEIVADPEVPIDVRFGCFYVVQTQLRRSREYLEFKSNVEKFFSAFESQPMFTFMRAEAYGDVAGDSASRELAIEFARKSVSELPNTPGVSHLLAEYLLESVEIGTKVAPGPEEKERLFEAEAAVNRAISLNGSYAKYHATKGRILTELGAEEAALSCFDKAIALEDGNTPKGEARIQSYQGFRREVSSRRNTRLLLETQKDAVSEFRTLRGELLSLLGLLAAVVAFISTSTNTATSLPLKQAIILQMSATGAIVVVFGVFAQLFVHQFPFRRFAWALGTGTCLIVVSWVLTFVYK